MRGRPAGFSTGPARGLFGWALFVAGTVVAEKAPPQLGHGELVHRLVVVGGGHGDVVGDEAAHLIEGGVEGGDVAVPGKQLGPPGNGVQVQQGEDAVGAVATPEAEHPGDGIVGEGGLDIPGPLGVVGGKVAVAAGGVAGGVGHRLQAQGLLVERKRFVQIRYIEIEVIECQHKLLLIAGGPLPPAWFGFSIAFLPPPGQGPFQTLPAASSFYPCYTISREKFVGFWLVL